MPLCRLEGAFLSRRRVYSVYKYRLDTGQDSNHFHWQAAKSRAGVPVFRAGALLMPVQVYVLKSHKRGRSIALKQLYHRKDVCLYSIDISENLDNGAYSIGACFTRLQLLWI